MFQESFTKLGEAGLYARDLYDRVYLVTLEIRQMIHANRIANAVTRFLETLEQYGYNPSQAPSVILWEHVGAQAVDALRTRLVENDGCRERNELEQQILLLICVIGPTLLSVQHEQTSAVFKLGVSLTSQVGRVLETSGASLALYAIVCPRLDVKVAVDALVREINVVWPDSMWTARSLSALSIGVSHLIKPLIQAADDLASNAKSCLKMGDIEMAAYISTFELIARIFSSGDDPVRLAIARYRTMLSYPPSPLITFNKMPVQYLKRISQYSIKREPWAMYGFITRPDLEAMKESTMLKGLHLTLQLRLAVLYDAPIEVLQAMADEGESYAEALRHVVGGLEWFYLVAIVGVRQGKTEAQLANEIRTLAFASKCTRFALTCSPVADDYTQHRNSRPVCKS